MSHTVSLEFTHRDIAELDDALVRLVAGAALFSTEPTPELMRVITLVTVAHSILCDEDDSPIVGETPRERMISVLTSGGRLGLAITLNDGSVR